MAAKDRKEQLQNELNLQNQLIASAKTHLILSEKGRDVKEQLLDKLRDEKDLGNQIENIQQAIDDLLLEQIERGDEVNQHYIEQLDRLKEILKLKNEQKTKEEEIKDLGKDFKDSLLGAVGLSSDMLKNGIAFGVGMAIAKKGLDMISSAFESSVGLAKELYTQVGATAAESARLGAQTTGAMFSMEGLLYGGEALASAAKSTADYYGSTQMITSDMQKNVTKLTAMGVQGAAEMNAIFGQAAGSAGDMTDSIETIAAKSGITTSALLAEMDGSMTRMVGKSKEQLETFAKQTAELKQQGASMELMNKAADSMLDIESSIKANMKARVFGIGIETDAIREAAMAYQYGEGSASDLAKAIQDQVGSAEDFAKLGEKQKQIYADQVGMSKEDLATMLIKEEEMQNLRNEYKGMSDEQIAKIQEQNEAWQATKTSLMSIGSTILGAVIPPLLQYFAISKAMKAMNSMGGGGGTPGGGAGGFMSSLGNINMGAVLKGAAAMLIVAAAVFVFAKALQEFTQVGWEEVGMAVVSMLALVGAVALLGMLMQGPVGAGVLIGAAAMLVVAAAMWVLGEAIQGVAKGFEMLGNLGEQFGTLVTMIPGLMALTGIFALMGVALMGLSVGLAAVSLFLPTLMVLGMVLPLIAGALGFGGGEESSAETGGSENNALLEEIKGLRMDIQNQPMQIVIDDKVVSTINRKNTRMEGYRKQMK